MKAYVTKACCWALVAWIGLGTVSAAPVVDTTRQGVQAYAQQDYERARRMLASAAEAGNGRALFHLGRMHSRGHGVEPNQKRASRLFLQAAKAGFGRAQAVIAARYMDGTGVARDDIAAYRWLTAAARQGNRQARKLRDQHLAERMDAQQLRRARERITDLP